MKNNNVTFKSVLSAAVAIVSTAVSTQAMSAQLEEVIVTAQKRAESIQDVPISVSALGGDKIESSGLQRLADAVNLIPNVTIAATSIGENINIRGIQSGSDAGFEQSVSTFVDGVYRGRGVQSKLSFLDVERLEVLRGPQGVLFGKNVIAGALSITSARPTEEFEGSVKATYNDEFDETEYRGHVSGALTDSLRGRVAALTREREEGWVENTRYNEGSPLVDEQGIRVILEADISDNTLLTFKHERAQWDNSGIHWEISELGSLAGIAQLGLAEDDVFDGTTNFGTFPLGPDANQELGTSQLMEGDSEETVLTLKHLFDNGGELTAIAAYSEYDFDRLVDADISVLDIVNFNDSEDFEQSSLEVRFASDQESRFSYIAGAFYQENDMQTTGVTPFGLTGAGGINGALAQGCAAEGGVESAYDPLTDDPLAIAAATAVANAGLTALGALNCSLSSILGPISALGLDGFNRVAELDQETESWALFGQFTWEFTDEFRTTVGLRYQEEEKTATHESYIAEYSVDGKTRSDNPFAALSGFLLGEITPHNFDDLSRDEESFTWSLNFQWDVTEDIMTYATASTGFKGGGFSSFHFSTAPDPANIEFEEEEVTTFELGSKMTVLDGAGEVNIALFRSEYKDMQVAVFSGDTTYNVENAANATTQGIEIDSRWQATDRLLLSAAFGWIDFEFDDFENQGCTNAQFLEFREGVWANGTNPLGIFANNSNCAAAGVNDLTGRTAAQTAEYSGTLSANYEFDINDDLAMSLSLDVIYRDESYRQDDLDENALDPASTFVNGSVRLASLNDTWAVTLNGYNLTDEESFDVGQDVPLANGAHFVQPKAPRSFAISASYRF